MVDNRYHDLLVKTHKSKLQFDDMFRDFLNLSFMKLLETYNNEIEENRGVNGEIRAQIEFVTQEINTLSSMVNNATKQIDSLEVLK